MSSTASSTAWSASRTAPPGGPWPPARRPPSRRARSWRRSAGRARRAGCGGRAAPRSPGLHPLGDHRGLDRSPAYLGKMTPRETSPTLCPARPTRCSPLATEGGDSTWMTRSTAPMSMPSSRLEVATTAGSRPALSASSISVRSAPRNRPVVRPRDDHGPVSTSGPSAWTRPSAFLPTPGRILPAAAPAAAGSAAAIALVGPLPRRRPRPRPAPSPAR